jgi:UDP-N-acetylmuramate: L-alanyl-gamma-D-glutamyl-meso-diaminopimelate ligase
VIDDFGHHPTAIRETISALRLKYPSARLWAVFEPRTNTTRRRVFQDQLPGAFMGADLVVIAQVDRLAMLPPEQRLDPAKLVADLDAAGKPAVYLPDVEAIIDHLVKNVQGGDVVCIFSNGAFGNIHSKLLARLAGKQI